VVIHKPLLLTPPFLSSSLHFLSLFSPLRTLGHCPISVSLRIVIFIFSVFFPLSHATDTRHSAARAPLVGDSRNYGIISSTPPLLFCTFEMVVYECKHLARHEKCFSVNSTAVSEMSRLYTLILIGKICVIDVLERI